MRVNIIKSFAIIAITSALFTLSAQEKIKENITQLISTFNGKVGVYVKSLETGETVEINADSLFPSASLIKVPILINLFDKIAVSKSRT